MAELAQHQAIQGIQGAGMARSGRNRGVWMAWHTRQIMRWLLGALLSLGAVGVAMAQDLAISASPVVAEVGDVVNLSVTGSMYGAGWYVKFSQQGPADPAPTPISGCENVPREVVGTNAECSTVMSGPVPGVYIYTAELFDDDHVLQDHTNDDPAEVLLPGIEFSVVTPGSPVTVGDALEFNISVVGYSPLKVRVEEVRYSPFTTIKVICTDDDGPPWTCAAHTAGDEGAGEYYYRAVMEFAAGPDVPSSDVYIWAVQYEPTIDSITIDPPVPVGEEPFWVTAYVTGYGPPGEQFSGKVNFVMTGVNHQCWGGIDLEDVFYGRPDAPSGVQTKWAKCFFHEGLPHHDTPYTVYVNYEGNDFNNQAPDSATVMAAVKVASQISIDPGTGPFLIGSTYPLEVTVNGYKPTGTVEVLVDNDPVCSNLELPIGANPNKSVICNLTAVAPVGDQTIGVTYSGDPSNFPESGQVVVTVKNASTTNLVLETLDPVEGQSLTFAAEVEGLDVAGDVAFFLDSDPVQGCSPVTLGQTGVGRPAPAIVTETARCTLDNGLAAGTYTMQVNYLGNDDNGPSGDALSFGVDPAVTPSTTTTLGVLPGSVVVGEDVNFSATVTGEAGQVLTGNLEFKAGSLVLCSVSLNDGDNVHIKAGTCAGQFPQVASYQVAAHYSADPNSASSASQEQPISVAPFSTNLVVDPVPTQIMVGESVALSVWLVAYAEDQGEIVGTVTFEDGLSGGSLPGCDPLPVIAVTPGQATMVPGTQPQCEIAGTVPGTMEVRVRFDGSPNSQGNPNNADRSELVGVLVVEQSTVEPTTTDIWTDRNEAIIDEEVLFSARVSGDSPSGIVTFSTDAGLPVSGCQAVALVTETAQKSLAECKTSFPTRGWHRIRASYSGNSGNDGSVSSFASVMIEGMSTTTELDVINMPAYVGRPTIVQATVRGLEVASGTVTFFDGGMGLAGCTAVPTFVLDGSSLTADCMVTFAQGGRHALSAAYSGDIRSEPSSGDLEIEVESDIPPLALSVLNTPLVDQPTGLQAAIHDLPLDGVVAFSDDGTLIDGCEEVAPDAAGSLDAVADCTAVFSQAGQHALAAEYSHSQGSETARLDIEVRRHASRVRIKAGDVPRGMRVGDPVPFAATVETDFPPEGWLDFLDGEQHFEGCEELAVTDDDGEPVAAVCEGVFEHSGWHLIKAAYSGDRVNAPAADVLRVGVADEAADLFLGMLEPATVGEPATVIATARGDLVEGTIRFIDDAQVISDCEEVPLGAPEDGTARASCEFAFERAGLHHLVAEHEHEDETVETAMSVSVARVVPTIELELEGEPLGSGSVVLHATLSGHLPSGSMQFSTADVEVLDCADLEFESGEHVVQVECEVELGEPAPLWVQVSYSGDDNNEPVVARLVTGAQVESSLSLVAPGGDVVEAGSEVLLQAEVVGSAPQGAVRFLRDDQAIEGCDAVALVETGDGETSIAECVTRFDSAGAYQLLAEYGGDDLNLPSSAGLEMVVTRRPVEVEVEVEAPYGAYYLFPFRLRITVHGHAPTGHLGVMQQHADGRQSHYCPDAAGAYGQLPLQPLDASRSVAECELAFMPPSGELPVTITYYGDAQNSSGSSQFEPDVGPRPTRIALERVEEGAVFAGGEVTLRAKLWVLAMVGDQAEEVRKTGDKVRFSDASGQAVPGCEEVVVQSIAVDGTGGALCTIPTPAAGSYVWQAAYAGDDLNQPAVSAGHEVSVFEPPVVTDVASEEHFGRAAISFALTNPGAQGLANIALHFNVLEVDQLVFAPRCETTVDEAGMVSVRCDDPTELGIACTDFGRTRVCSIGALEAGGSRSFLVVPVSDAASAPRVAVLVDDRVVAESLLEPGQ